MSSLSVKAVTNRHGHVVTLEETGKGHIKVWGNGVTLSRDEVIELRDWINARYPTQPADGEPVEAGRKDAERLDFILTKARKVVVDCISNGRFDVYVEEGVMGDVAYPGVRREFVSGVGSTQELAAMREAIDAAMRAQGDGSEV